MCRRELKNDMEVEQGKGQKRKSLPLLTVASGSDGTARSTTHVDTLQLDVSEVRTNNNVGLPVALFGFLPQSLAHASREKNLTCMESKIKFICKTFLGIGVTFRDESNYGN